MSLITSSNCIPLSEPRLAGVNTLPEQYKITIIDLCSNSSLAEHGRDECVLSRCWAAHTSLVWSDEGNLFHFLTCKEHSYKQGNTPNSKHLCSWLYLTDQEGGGNSSCWLGGLHSLLFPTLLSFQKCFHVLWFEKILGYLHSPQQSCGKRTFLASR